jgi:hypothetical protein
MTNVPLKIKDKEKARNKLNICKVLDLKTIEDGQKSMGLVREAHKCIFFIILNWSLGWLKISKDNHFLLY